METFVFFVVNRFIRYMFLLAFLMVIFSACGPIRPPGDAYQDASTLLSQMEKKRSPVKSFRMAGAIDHMQEQRIRGKAYMFARLPHNLRIDVLSPFGTTLSVLTANEKKFGLSDYKVSRFFTGEPSPCNVAKFVGIALPPGDIITILMGKVPIIEGEQQISWHPDGHYIVTIAQGVRVQTLHIGADKDTLPLLGAQLHEHGTLIFDVSFEMWRMTGNIAMPYEIRVNMPREKAALFIQYEDDGVELNVDLPTDAWEQTIPSGAKLEQLSCN